MGLACPSSCHRGESGVTDTLCFPESGFESDAEAVVWTCWTRAKLTITAASRTPSRAEQSLQIFSLWIFILEQYPFCGESSLRFGAGAARRRVEPYRFSREGAQFCE